MLRITRSHRALTLAIGLAYFAAAQSVCAQTAGSVGGSNRRAPASSSTAAFPDDAPPEQSAPASQEPDTPKSDASHNVSRRVSTLDDSPPPAPEPPAPAEEPRSTWLSVTLSPFHLIGPILELQGEVRLSRLFGAALIAGYGRRSHQEAINGEDPSVPYLINTSTYDVLAVEREIGTQFVYYPLSDFQSLELGAEILWVNISTTTTPAGFGFEDTELEPAGLRLGPFFGFKLIVGPGFTAFAQAGMEYITLREESTDEDLFGSQKDPYWTALLNLNLGWSF